MKKIKVLQFPVANSKGGITQYILQNWKYIDRSKFQFDFATMSKHLDFGQSLEKEGCKVHYISCYAEENKEIFVDEFRKILVEGNYDVVHLHTKQWKSFLVEQLAKEAGVKKIIIHAHSTGIDTLDMQKREEEIRLHNSVLEQLTQDTATDFWACSWKAADFIFGDRIPRQKIKILKNAIELSKFAYNADVRRRYREELGISADEFVVGNVGRMVFPKNQEFLLEAFSEVCKNNVNDREHLRLLLVGEGEREKEYRNIVQKNNLEERVIFTGHRKDVPELLQAMDIFCLPSRFEGLPISLIEAQAAGLPCIVSDLVTDEVIISDIIVMKALDLKLWEKEIVHLYMKRNERDRNVSINQEYEIGRQIKEIEEEYCK